MLLLAPLLSSSDKPVDSVLQVSISPFSPWKIERKNDQANREHPKSKNWKHAEYPAKQKSSAYGYSEYGGNRLNSSIYSRNIGIFVHSITSGNLSGSGAEQSMKQW